jgi:CRP-like cAMP-binding protein
MIEIISCESTTSRGSPTRRREAWLDLADHQRVGVRHLAAGEVLFRQGDPASIVYLVEQGRIRLARSLEDGSSVAVHVARDGETVAEASLFADVYHCEAVAEATSRVVAIPRTEILATITGDPRASLDLARLLASQVRDLRARLELRNIRSAPERILAWLRLRAEGNPPTVTLDQTWTEIAAELGLTREAVYRGLAELARRRAIRRSMSRVVIDRR